jgi:hypothetical protein
LDARGNAVDKCQPAECMLIKRWFSPAFRVHRPVKAVTKRGHTRARKEAPSVSNRSKGTLAPPYPFMFQLLEAISQRLDKYRKRAFLIDDLSETTALLQSRSVTRPVVVSRAQFSHAARIRS